MQPTTLEQRIVNAQRHAVAFVGVCFRAVPQQFATVRHILSTQGSVLAGGRYNYIGTFGALYLSCDVHTCVEETTRSLRLNEHEVALRLPRTIIGVEVSLNRVLDLTDARIRRRLGVRKRDLLGDWEYDQNVRGVEVLTQCVGRLARGAGFEALLVPSVMTRGRNLVVFVDRLLPSSSLRIINVHYLQRSGDLR